MRALWWVLGQHGFGLGQMAFREVGPFGLIPLSFVSGWIEASHLRACDAGKMVFFTPS